MSAVCEMMMVDAEIMSIYEKKTAIEVVSCFAILADIRMSFSRYTSLTVLQLRIDEY